jgi:hypothetical protein
MSSKQYNAKYVYPSNGNSVTPEMQAELNATRVSYNPSNPYKYTFSGTVEGKDAARQRAIIDTICYMGWMSLKDSDHNVSGINAAACKRIQKEAVETRKAAESLLNAGTITVIGEWSNGIRVGAGPQFVHIDHSAETKIALDTYEKNQSKGKRTVKGSPVMRNEPAPTWRMVKGQCDMLPAHPMYAIAQAARDAQYAAAQAENDAAWGKALDEEAAVEMNPHTGRPRYEDDEEEIFRLNALAVEKMAHDAYAREGEMSPMRYADGAACTVNIVKASKPRYRVPLALMRAYHGLVDVEVDAIADAAIAAITGEEYSAPAFVAPAYVAPAFVAPAMPAPTPIRPTEHYTPRVGDTIEVIYRHENGTTTTRTVDVQRVGPSLFRGYDRTFNRVRNFEYAHITHCELARKEEVA